MPRVLLAIAISLFAFTSATAQDWTRYRGDNGTGISNQKGIPVTWSPADYKWKITLPGEGHSSPVIWKKKLFVTSAIDRGAVRYLFCIDTDTGKTLWTRETGMSRTSKHPKSSWASATPVVDAERVYVAQSDKAHFYLTAYTHAGELVWRNNLGEFGSRHGLGVSPMLFENLVIIPNDQTGPSSIVAFDKKTGRTAWSTLRSFRRVSYATPMVYREPGQRPQLICASGAMGLTSLDPHTGRMNWMTGELPMRTVASPVLADGLLIQSCGGGGKGKLLIAVDPRASAPKAKSRIVYERKKILPYVPTPIAYEGHVYLWNDDGVVSCIVAKTGRNVWTKRVGGGYSGSPICIDGKLYMMSEKGEVVVLAASPTFKLLGKTSLEDGSHATPAIAHGRLYLRTFRHLICLEAQK